jgi:WD40 repeat protein
MFFTPDNQWLTDGYRRWQVGTWTEGPGRPTAGGPSALAFSTDGTMFAGQTNDESVHLVDVENGKTLVQLGLPEQNRSRFAAFSPDGTQLVVQSADNGYVYSWDLRTLRRHLADLGLDWKAPALPEAPRGAKRSPPVVTVLFKPVVEGQILVDKKDSLTEKDPGYMPNTKDLDPRLKGFVQLLNSINGHPHKVYTLKLNKDDKVVIQQMSNEIDSVVVVEDAKNNILALNDDDPGVKNTLDSKLVWTVPADGEYRIIATCMTEVRPSKYGNFRLTVTKSP